MKETKICSLCDTEKTLNKSSWYANNECSACRARVKYKDSNRNEYKNKWREANKEHCKQWRLNYIRDRFDNDPIFKLKKNLRNRLNQAIKNNQKSGSAVDDLGCSIEELKIHLQSKFKLGMNWNNYGEWHIDHIKPLVNFDLSKTSELKEACHYTNLQPLWAKDNIRKGSKYE